VNVEYCGASMSEVAMHRQCNASFVLSLSSWPFLFHLSASLKCGLARWRRQNTWWQ